MMVVDAAAVADLADLDTADRVAELRRTIAELQAAIYSFFDGVPGHEEGEVDVNATQLPSPKAANQ